jgi:hypothetical protein
MRVSVFVLAAAVLTASCSSGLRRPANTTPGTPNVTWVLMYGDSDNPDREFSCQSGPQMDCVLPPSRPGEQVFSDIHFYYHGAGAQTRYEGTRTIAYLSGPYTSPTSVTVEKDQPLANQSVTGIVTSTPGTYDVVLSLTATVTGNPNTVPVRETIRVTVK